MCLYSCNYVPVIVKLCTCNRVIMYLYSCMHVIFIVLDTHLVTVHNHTNTMYIVHIVKYMQRNIPEKLLLIYKSQAIQTLDAFIYNMRKVNIYLTPCTKVWYLLCIRRPVHNVWFSFLSILYWTPCTIFWYRFLSIKNLTPCTIVWYRFLSIIYWTPCSYV